MPAHKAYPQTLDRDDVLFFLHIPKTAGTSLTQSLVERWGEDVTITPERLNTIRQVPASVLQRVKFVYGHFNRTICRNRLIVPPNFTITFFRDPVSHYLSIYNHIRRDPDFGFTTRATKGDLALSHKIAEIANTGDIRAFLDAPECSVFDNFQTKYLVDGIRFKPDLQESEALVDEALACLELLGSFGITDRYNESLQLINRALNLSEALTPRKVNEAPNSEQLEIAEDIIEEIRYRTRYDLILYNSALALFNQRLQQLEASSEAVQH